MVEQRPFKPLVVGSTPTAPTNNPDDSVVLALLNLPNKAIKRAFWSQDGPNLKKKNGGGLDWISS